MKAGGGNSIASVKLELSKLNSFFDHNARDPHAPQVGVLGIESASAHPPAGSSADGPHFGHRDDTSHRDFGSGKHPENQIPVTGTPPLPKPHRSVNFDSQPKYESGHHNPDPNHDFHAGGFNKLPKMNFPHFDGENPKLWPARSEDYFDMYQISCCFWVCVASMHFSGPAACWLQSIEHKVVEIPWSQFCALVLDRFGRDQHETLICQLFHIAQNGTVAEYVEQFSELVDQLRAYASVTDPLYYTMRFIDGLRPDIKSSIIVQRPKDLDTVVVLAFLQDVVAGVDHPPPRKWESPLHQKPEFPNTVKQQPRGAYPLLPPPRQDYKAPLPVADDKRGTEAARTSTSPDKHDALKRYRMARGLCKICAEKWFKGHKCNPSVQLHAVEELWALLSDVDVTEGNLTSPPEAPQLYLALSRDAFLGSAGPKTMKLQGQLQGKDAIILIDLGSSHSFLNSRLAAELSGISALPNPMKVTVANGESLVSSVQLPSALWSVQRV